MQFIFIVVGINLLSVAAMYAVESIESYIGRTPRRSKTFLYLQDWNVMLVGDVIGLSIIDAMTIPKLILSDIPTVYTLLALTFGFFFTLLMLAYVASPRHRPDSGVPKIGILSLYGALHAVYFFLQASVGMCGLMLLCTGNLSTAESFWGLCGAFVYVAAMLSDWKKFLPR